MLARLIGLCSVQCIWNIHISGVPSNQSIMGGGWGGLCEGWCTGYLSGKNLSFESGTNYSLHVGVGSANGLKRGKSSCANMVIGECWPDYSFMYMVDEIVVLEDQVVDVIFRRAVLGIFFKKFDKHGRTFRSKRQILYGIPVKLTLT